MEPSLQLAGLAALGLVGGLLLLVRGFSGFREAARIGDTSTSRIATLAVGEVRVTGVVEPAELALVSPLQSARCIFYRSSISRATDDVDDDVFREERAVGFRVRDETGTVRVFPRGARFDVPDRFSESSDPFGGEPPGLQRRAGGAFAEAELSREDQIAALLTVRQPMPASIDHDGGGAMFGGFGMGVSVGSRRTQYREARIEPGEIVTVVGQVLPFDQLPDPTGADVGGDVLNPLGSLVDAEISADLAVARRAGNLAATPEEAWGNAAIPGFGIGRPVSAPVLDPDADAPALATAEQAERSERRFEIGDHDLVLAAAIDVPLVIALGSPAEATARHESQFLTGLVGAVLAIGSAVALALLLGGLPG